MNFDQEITEEPPVFPEEQADKQIFYTQVILWCSIALLPGHFPELPWGSLIVFVGCTSILLTCRSWQLGRRLKKKQRRWREQAAKREQERRLIDLIRTADLGTHNNIYGPVNAPVVQSRDIRGVNIASPTSGLSGPKQASK
ncbi:hypothetical protein NE857_01785 [Nocardiopsis exhalans]|uniref:Transmembrane protein n=1 Tax=Nocardiopsis exhalans TaxID=163604 RepID=A0ABY5DBL1_9ACTN|nr:hypothetical protein [Nocardiopsis exhalans]USY20420.1 hypothetical protein NE857_01785 [Nocardiopsis exhalans]